jgi:hypothetical protein
VASKWFQSIRPIQRSLFIAKIVGGQINGTQWLLALLIIFHGHLWLNFLNYFKGRRLCRFLILRPVTLIIATTCLGRKTVIFNLVEERAKVFFILTEFTWVKIARIVIPARETSYATSAFSAKTHTI